jgi:hypothetical protein
MAKEVELPDGSIGEFPDTMDDAQIQAVLRKQFGGGPPAAPSFGQRVSGMLSKGKAAVQSGLNAVDTLGGRLPGTPPGAFTPPASVNPMPGSLTEAGVTYGVPVGGRLAKFGGAGQQALARLTGGLVGGGAGSVMEGKNPVSQEGAMTIAAPLALGEIFGGGVPRVAQMFPGVKSAISESNARNLHGTLADIDPDIGRVIARQQVKPTLKGGTTAAKIQQGIKGGDVQNTASASMERDVGAVNMLSNAPKFNSPAIKQAYDALPDLEKQMLVGAVDPAGFTLKQAQAIRGYLGSGAFGMSPQGQGVSPVAKQMLWGDVGKEIEGGLSPVARPLWQQANRRYAGTMGATDALSDRNAFQGLNNRILLNRNQLSDYLAQNREDMVRRLGPQGYDALVERVLGGAQPGTRDILTPGAGGVTDAFMQTFGRGQGGSPQMLGAPLRTVLPNLGSQYTGRRPFSIPPQLQELLDVIFQRQAGQVNP